MVLGHEVQQDVLSFHLQVSESPIHSSSRTQRHSDKNQDILDGLSLKGSVDHGQKDPCSLGCAMLPRSQACSLHLEADSSLRVV